MPEVIVEVECSAPPDRVLAAARDFSERRLDLFPNLRVKHYEVHELGDTFADVTEGTTGKIWERLRYDWSEPGVVTARLIEGSPFTAVEWELRATPNNGGSRMEVRMRREFKGVRGRLMENLMFRPFAKRLVARDLRTICSHLEKEKGQS